MEYDYLIIGQGLAGSCFAMQALERGRQIAVVDKHAQNHSSVIAAGLYNPITGKNWIKTWMADQLFPYAESFYQNYERLTASNFLYKIPVYRPFPDLQMQNEWMGKSSEPAYKGFIDAVTTNGLLPYLNDPFGGLLLAQSGRLDVPLFISVIRKFLADKAALYDEKIDPEEMKIVVSQGRFRDCQFKRIIFCEGAAARENMLWSWLPHRPVRGEIIEIESELNPPLEIIPNRGVFITPLPTLNRYKVGATYDYHYLEPIITEKGEKQLTDRLSKLFSEKYVIKKQMVGLRPASIDRRPLLGMHPDRSNCYIFNGLGTKGVTLAPYFAEQLLDFIERGKDLSREVDIKRFL